MVSLREAKRELSRCITFELEDVIRECEGARLIAPRRPETGPVLRLAADLLERRAGVSLERVGGHERIELVGRYDLLLCVVQNAPDLAVLRALGDWRSRCSVAVCLIEEMWRGWVGDAARKPPELRSFDHVFLSCAASVDDLSAALGRPCSYVPPAVDTLRFCPHPAAPPRCIDVFGMGRRSEVTHRALLKLASEKGLFYVHDTVGAQSFLDPAQHRDQLANFIRRSRYFIANRAKADVPEHTGGQEEVGFRFFEGAAGGAVMIGDPPRGRAFRELFDWPDAVVEMPYDTTAVGELLEELDSQPGRLARIRRDNVVHSLRRHDWVHRWETMLDALGLPLGPAARERKARLERLADEVERKWSPPQQPEDRKRPSADI